MTSPTKNSIRILLPKNAEESPAQRRGEHRTECGIRHRRVERRTWGRNENAGEDVDEAMSDGELATTGTSLAASSKSRRHKFCAAICSEGVSDGNDRQGAPNEHRIRQYLDVGVPAAPATAMPADDSISGTARRTNANVLEYVKSRSNVWGWGSRSHKTCTRLGHGNNRNLVSPHRVPQARSDKDALRRFSGTCSNPSVGAVARRLLQCRDGESSPTWFDAMKATAQLATDKAASEIQACEQHHLFRHQRTSSQAEETFAIAGKLRQRTQSSPVSGNSVNQALRAHNGIGRAEICVVAR